MAYSTTQFGDFKAEKYQANQVTYHAQGGGTDSIPAHSPLLRKMVELGRNEVQATPGGLSNFRPLMRITWDVVCSDDVVRPIVYGTTGISIPALALEDDLKQVADVWRTWSGGVGGYTSPFAKLLLAGSINI